MCPQLKLVQQRLGILKHLKNMALIFQIVGIITIIAHFKMTIRNTYLIN